MDENQMQPLVADVVESRRRLMTKADLPPQRASA